MSTVQKYIGPDHKISIHQHNEGDWEIAVISADPKNTFFVSPYQWAVSADGLNLLFLEAQCFDDDDTIHCVRVDQFPKLWEAARRYGLTQKKPVCVLDIVQPF